MSDWVTPTPSTKVDSAWGEPMTASGSGGGAWGGGATDAASDAGGDDSFGGPANGERREGGGGGGGCFNCGEDGHNKADCPKPRSMEGMTCRACNKEGHMAKDCPDKGPMMCRHCNQEGHVVKDCPDGPPQRCRRCGEEGHHVKECPHPEICKNCGEEGHGASACKSARKVDRSHFPDMSTEDAWAIIVNSAKAHELDDVKDGVQIYLKANPETTYIQLEEAFRSQDVGVFLIAIEKPYMAPTLTNMDLQGNMDKKYTVTYRFNAKPTRPRERHSWPETPEQNLERLADAGEVVDRGIMKCSNCNELGHSSRACPEEKQESGTVRTVKCFNCDGEGHRVRDCPIPRVDRFACKNCGKGGHVVKECPEPRSAEGVECRKCGETGHFSKDCPQGGGGGCRNCGQEGHKAADCTEPKDMSKVQCRNCDEYGHGSRDCPKPRDYSRVKCQNCQEMGHTKVRCKKPLVSEDDAGDRGFDNGGSADAAPADEEGGSSWPEEPASTVDVNSAW